MPGKLDRSPKANWVENRGGLPSYIERIAVHLNNKGMSISHAIATAINAAKKMCSTGDLNWPGLQQVNLGSKGQACAAVAQWEAMKSKSSKVKTSAGLVNPYEVLELSLSYQECWRASKALERQDMVALSALIGSLNQADGAVALSRVLKHAAE